MCIVHQKVKTEIVQSKRQRVLRDHKKTKKISIE